MLFFTNSLVKVFFNAFYFLYFILISLRSLLFSLCALGFVFVQIHFIIVKLFYEIHYTQCSKLQILLSKISKKLKASSGENWSFRTIRTVNKLLLFLWLYLCGPKIYGRSDQNHNLTLPPIHSCYYSPTLCSSRYVSKKSKCPFT